MAYIAAVGTLLFLAQAALIESQALDHPRSVAMIVAGLALTAGALRWFVARTGDAEVQFEESEPPAIQTLGLQVGRPV